MLKKITLSVAIASSIFFLGCTEEPEFGTSVKEYKTTSGTVSLPAKDSNGNDYPETQITNEDLAINFAQNLRRTTGTTDLANLQDKGTNKLYSKKNSTVTKGKVGTKTVEYEIIDNTPENIRKISQFVKYENYSADSVNFYAGSATKMTIIKDGIINKVTIIEKGDISFNGTTKGSTVWDVTSEGTDPENVEQVTEVDYNYTIKSGADSWSKTKTKDDEEKKKEEEKNKTK